MKRIFAVMISAVLLVTVTAAPALAAETYVIEFGPENFISTLPLLEGNETGIVYLDYIIPEGLYNFELYWYDLLCASGSFSVSYSWNEENSCFFSYSDPSFSFLVPDIPAFYVGAVYTVDLEISFFIIGAEGYPELGLYEGCSFSFTPVSDSFLSFDVVSDLLTTSFDMMISNPLTTTLTAAGLIGVAIPVFVKLKKSARR